MSAGLPRETDLVDSILTACGLPAMTLDFLAQGATSRVWRADTSHGAVVIRLGDPVPGKAARFHADVAVRRRLFQADGRVAEPLAVGCVPYVAAGGGPARPWCVDRFIVGHSAPRGAIPARVCQDLGHVLTRLHALPVCRHGLLEDRPDVLRGQARDPIGGLLTRLQDPWPFTPVAVEDHPLVQAAPDLAAPLAPLEDRLRAIVLQSPSCLTHSDLHEGQLRIAEGRLVGLLDFGDATIGAPPWDIASFAYFHGWELAQVVLTGYTDDATHRDEMLAGARLFAVLIALHHASRAVTLHRPHRLQHAIRFLRGTVARQS